MINRLVDDCWKASRVKDHCRKVVDALLSTYQNSIDVPKYKGTEDTR